jgi:predicted ribonuclease YlaK
MPKGHNNQRRTKNFKEQQGEGRVIDKKLAFERDYKLDWFHPAGDQLDIIDSIDRNDLTIVNGRSGTGKSTVALYKALQEYRVGNFKKIYFVKSPTESGDDMLVYLSGDKNSKLEAHIHVTKNIFTQFITPNKLDNDMSNGNIVIDIPNFMLGATLDNCILIIDEAQMMSPSTVKLLIERAGLDTKVVIMGDSQQRYSVKKREDGFADLIRRTTFETHGRTLPNVDSPVGYVQLDSSNNQRSALSRFITELYDDI